MDFYDICTKHKDWEIDWESVETMRLLRNGVHYEGRPITADTWKAYKLKFDIHTRLLIKEFEKKVKEFMP